MNKDRNNKIKTWCNLYKASQEGDLEEVQSLLNVGVDISYEHPDFVNSPLIAASQNGYLDVVKCLIENGANPYYLSKVSKKTAKDYAKERGYLHVYNYLNKLFPKLEKYHDLLSSFSLN